MNTGTGTEPQKTIDRTSVWLNMAEHTGQFLCFLERSSLAESTQRLNEPPDVMLVSLHVPASFNNTYQNKKKEKHLNV